MEIPISGSCLTYRGCGGSHSRIQAWLKYAKPSVAVRKPVGLGPSEIRILFCIVGHRCRSGCPEGTISWSASKY